MTLQEFSKVLLSVTDKVYHLEAWKESDEYIVWQEIQNRSSYGENGRFATVKRVQVDLFTKEEFSELLDKLLETLEENDVASDDPVPDYNKDTKVMRYIIQCEVI
jgi:hypothetical protein